MIVAGWAGRIVTVAVGAWFAIIEPLLSKRAPDTATVIWVALIGSFLWRGASAAISVGRTRAAVSRLRVQEVMRPVVSLPLTASAASVSAGLVATPQAQYAVLVDPLGRPVAVVDTAKLLGLPEDALHSVSASELALGVPAEWVVVTDPSGDATAVVQRLAGDGADVPGLADVLAVDSAHRVLGSVSLVDVERQLVAAPR